MASTGGRLLELLALLQARHRWSGDDLALRLGVSDRTLRRDIDRLRSLGYPVAADRGVDGGYQLGPGARLPPLLVTGDEAVAVAVGLLHAARQPITGIADAAARALTKIAAILPGDARREVDSIATTLQLPVGASAEVSLDALTVLTRASRDTQRARFTYHDAMGARSERSVEPHHVVPMGWRWYLVAWDLDREDWRTFRLDRISEPHVTKRSFEPRALPEPDAATFVAVRLSSRPTAHEVEVVVAAPVAVVERHLGPWGDASEAGPDTTRITMQVDDLSWVVLILAAIDADIHHGRPPELVALLHRLGRRFAAVPAPGATDEPA